MGCFWTGRRSAPDWPSLLLAIVMSVLAGSASAAVPVFPDNLVVFPNRDFLSAKGFQDHVGRVALWWR